MQSSTHEHNQNNLHHRNKINCFLPSSQQFSIYIEKNFPEALQYDIKGYFNKLSEWIHTEYFDVFLNYLINCKKEKRNKEKFQRFLINKCRNLKTKNIDLDDLQNSCTSFDDESILLISILYYFT